MNSLKQWWIQLSSRDQMAVFALSVVVFIYILYAAILKPVHGMKAKQQRSYHAAQQNLDKVRTLAAKWTNRDQGSVGGGGSASIVEIVDRSLRENGLRLSGMQPSGSGNVRLRLEQVKFDDLLPWLHEMEVVKGMQVKDLSVAMGSDPGIVSVNVRLQRN